MVSSFNRYRGAFKNLAENYGWYLHEVDGMWAIRSFLDEVIVKFWRPVRGSTTKEWVTIAFSGLEMAKDDTNHIIYKVNNALTGFKPEPPQTENEYGEICP